MLVVEEVSAVLLRFRSSFAVDSQSEAHLLLLVTTSDSSDGHMHLLPPHCHHDCVHKYSVLDWYVHAHEIVH